MKSKSLKKEILVTLLSFIIFIGVSIGVISLGNFYFSKLSIIEHNQRQTLTQIEKEINKFLTQIYSLSNYLKYNYTPNNVNLLKNIVDTNNNISSIIILNKNGIIEDYYADSNLNIYK